MVVGGESPGYNDELSKSDQIKEVESNEADCNGSTKELYRTSVMGFLGLSNNLLFVG